MDDWIERSNSIFSVCWDNYYVVCGDMRQSVEDNMIVVGLDCGTLVL